MNYILKNEYLTATFSKRGAELISFKYKDERELLWTPKPDKFWTYTAPFIFPICATLLNNSYTYGGKSYEMKIHGIIKDTDLDVVYQDDTKIVFSVTLFRPDVYPFKVLFTAKYELIGDKLLVNVEIKNLDEKVMPYMFGWHPGFILHTDEGQKIEDYVIYFDKCEKVTRTPLQNIYFARSYGEDYPLVNSQYRLSEEEIYKNDTMMFSDCKNNISLKADGHPFRIDMTWSENLPYFCVWKTPVHEENFICLEAWTGTQNDGEHEEIFETRKMEHLAPGETAKYGYTVKISF